MRRLTITVPDAAEGRVDRFVADVSDPAQVASAKVASATKSIGAKPSRSLVYMAI